MFHVDLHSHTRYSHDARTDPSDFVERARESGLDRIAVTDHGTIEGALRTRELDPELVIVGEEIRCACRTELIGLFLEERIPMLRPLEEVVERIRDQGGVIYAPHPFAYPREARARARKALEVADVVEAINARAFLPYWNRAATRAARRAGIPLGAGSDAHFPWEIGRARAVMPAFTGVAGFRDAIAASRPVQLVTSSPALHVASMGVKYGRRVAEAWASTAGWSPRGRSVARAS